MSAPAGLQQWVRQAQVKLALPVVIPAGEQAYAKALVAKPYYSDAHDEQDVAMIFAVSDEMFEMQNASDRHQAALASWLGKHGNNTAWARDAGALAAELNWKEVEQERQSPIVGPQTIASSLSRTIPAGTPARIRQDLDRLAALGIGSNPTGPQLDQTFYGVRADLLKTYGVKPGKFGPI